jgi:putative ABC transport system permease protein
MHQLKHAVRALYRHPGFTIPAILALALGIGAATAIFSVVDCVLLRPLPYPQSDRLVSVAAKFPDGAEILPSTEFLNWSRSNHVLESFAAQGAGGQGSLIGPDGATPVTLQKVTVGFMGTLRVRPALGRDFLPVDGKVGAPNVAIVSYAMRASFGKAINLDGTPYQVVGVLPATFRYMPRLEPLDVLLPIQISPSSYTDRADMRAWRPIGRLKPGVTVAQARAEFGAMLVAAIRDTAREMPKLYPGAQIRVTPYHDLITGGVRAALLLLLGGVACVLLIACANVANLLLARGAGRQREIAVRAALGASRSRLVRHLLAESLILAAMGGVMGVAICFAAIPAIRSAMAHKLPRIADLTVDFRVLGFALLLSASTGVVFGLMPALRASRTDLGESMKRGAGRAGMWLVAAELALSLTLLVSAGLLFQSLWRSENRHLGFDAEHLLVADVSLRGTHFAKSPPSDIEGRLQGIPGAVSWTVTDGLPPNGGCCGVTLARPGMPATPSRSPADLTIVRNVTPGYFTTMGIALKRGRLPDAHDTNVAVINEELARRYFAGEDPVGKALRVPPRTIIGVVANAKNDGLRGAVKAEMIFPMRAMQGSVQVGLRSAGDPMLVARALRQQLHEMDPLIVASLKTMREEFQEQTAQPRFLSGLFGVFAIVALALGILGIYGVMAFAVVSRTREIGIRMALGADGARVLRMVLRDAAAPVVAGVVLGIAGSVAAGRYLGSVLYDIKATDPATYAMVAMLLAAVAFGASLIPAKRASRVDPVVVLRAE